MIGNPQSDLRHIGHVGYDGAVFGDVSFIGDNYDKLPVKVGNTGTLCFGIYHLKYFVFFIIFSMESSLLTYEYVLHRFCHCCLKYVSLLGISSS